MNNKEKFLSKRGQICSISITKPLKLRKEISGVLVKKSMVQARAGVNYKNIKEVKEAGVEPQKLPWGEWETFPHIIKHNDTLYFRFSHLNNSKKKVKYLYNGEEITEDKAKELALASEFRSDEPIVFNVKEENIESLS